MGLLSLGNLIQCKHFLQFFCLLFLFHMELKKKENTVKNQRKASANVTFNIFLYLCHNNGVTRSQQTKCAGVGLMLGSY